MTQWQADYNSVADDLWEDDETKEELHQRVAVSGSEKRQRRDCMFCELDFSKMNPGV